MTDNSVLLTRVFRQGGDTKNQKFYVNPEAVTTLRPSNALGTGHRSTITVDGVEYNLANPFSEAARWLNFS